MFGFYPFFNNFDNNNYNNNNNNYNNGYYGYSGNNYSRISDSSNIGVGDLLNADFLSSIMENLLSSDVINEFVNDIVQDEAYDVELKEYDNYYLIKGYLPGIGPKDVSIDFEKNKAILTIKRKQTYSNGRNTMVTIIQSGGDLVKNFYIGEVDVSKLRASFDNALLLLTIPKVKNITEEPLETQATIIDVDNYVMK